MPLDSPKAQEISSYLAGSLATPAQMRNYRGFPERLHHWVPHWVEPGALFHIRMGLGREKQQRTLIDPSLAPALLDSATLYEANMRWHMTLFLLMPDHVHAVLSFPRDKSMSEIIRALETLSDANAPRDVAGRIFRSSTAR
ncbi:MAG: transposase [Candidatus Udaeobacter sp.]